MTVTGKRIALAGLGLAVAVGIALLVMSVLGGASGATKRAPEVRQAAAGGRTEVVDSIAKTRKGQVRAHDSEPADPTPGLDPDDPTAVVEPDGTTVYTKDDGTVVRDHRTAAPQDVPPLAVSKATMLSVRNDIRPLVQECGKAIRRRRDGTKGKMQADLTLSVADGRVTVDGLDLHVTGLNDSEYTSCVRKAVEGFVMFAPDDQTDVAAHTLSLPFSVP